MNPAWRSEPRNPNVLRGLKLVAAMALASLIFPALCGGVAHAQVIRLPNSHPLDVSALKPNLVSSNRPLNLRIALALRNRAQMEKLLREQQDPASPQYHRWLTPEQFAAQFGPAPADVQAVERWLSHAGFRVTGQIASMLQVQGTIGQAASLFAVQFAGSSDGRLYANLQDPAIPSQFASVISAIDGLNNLVHANHSATQMPPIGASLDVLSFRGESSVPMTLAENVPSAEPRPERSGPGVLPSYENQFGVAFGPSDFYTFYDENSLLNYGIDGSGGGCFAVVEDSDFSDAAVSAFNSTFSLPAVSLTRIFVDSGTNPGYTSDEVEALIDVEWGHAVAPGAAVRAYIGDGSLLGAQALVDALAQAVQDNTCTSIDLSFYFCGGQRSFYTEILGKLYQQAALQGQSVFVSSGDEGAAGLVFNAKQNACVTATSRHVNEAAADPYVTAVGGTQFVPNYNGAGQDQGSVPENTWNETVTQGGTTTHLGASGGGASPIFVKPAFQAGPGVPNDNKRDVPDVALAAGLLQPGYFLGDDPNQNGGALLDCCFGGTSVGAAIWAGIAQLIGQLDLQRGSAGACGGTGRCGSMNPRIYLLGDQMDTAATGIRDVTSGNNSFNGVTGFSAHPGYDQTTGWGTPDLGVFVNAFVNGSFVLHAGNLSVAPKQRHFPPQLFSSVGSTSPQQAIAIINRNPVNLPATFSSISVTGTNPGDFQKVGDTCAPVLAAKSRCSVELVFKPTGLGLRSATLTVSGAFANSPLEIPLVGSAVAPILHYGPKSFCFGKVALGTTSPGRTVTLTNTTKVPIDVGSIVSSSNDFTETDDCVGTPIAPQGGQCTMTVTFKPSVQGPESATFTITDDARGGTQLIHVCGRGY